MRKFFQGWFLAAELMLLGCVGAAYANYDGTQGTGTHFVAFDATHSGTSLCAAANTQCVAFVVIDSAGTEKGTVANPLVVTSTGLTQGSSTSGQAGALVMGAALTSPPAAGTAYLTGSTNPLVTTLWGGLLTSPTQPTVTAANVQNGATANGNGTALTVQGYQTAILDVVCSVTCSGGTLINFEGTDAVGTFFAIQGVPIAGGAGASNTTAPGVWVFNVAGLTSIRARISAYSAGTISVTGTLSTAMPPYIVGSTPQSTAVRGAANTTGGSATTVLAAAGAGIKNYVTDVECGNTSATTVTVAFTDAATSVLILPAGGGNNKTFQTPLVTAANTAFQFTASTGVTTVSCNAQGYTGP